MRCFFGFWAIVLTAAAALSLTLIAPVPPVTFESADEVFDFAASHGFSVLDDGTPCRPRRCFFIADHPIDREDVADIPRRNNCGLTAEWRGVVWVTQIRSGLDNLCVSSIGGNMRIWGNVVVAGDEEVLDRIKQLRLETGR